MKKVYIVGIGMSADTMTAEGIEIIKSAEVIAGAKRILEITSFLYKKTVKRIYPYYTPKEISKMISDEKGDRFVILVSGDVGFYSGAARLKEELKEHDIQFIPGVSTVNYFFARLGFSWQETAFASAHGRKTNIIDIVRRNPFVFCLTGNNVCEIGIALTAAGFGNVKAYVGENLGAKCERIYETIAEKLKGDFSPLTVLLFQNENFNDSTPSGLCNNNFLRLDDIPMTKSEVRAVIMSKLKLKPFSVCYDIGAGTGSVTVEMALSAYCGHVYAVERREAAISLINQNCRNFHIGNFTAVLGEAPAVLESLPIPDAVFIGGSGGKIDEIIKLVFNKNKNAQIVLSAITIETVSLVLETFKSLEKEPSIIQISIASGKVVGNLHMMEAQNPITIISWGGNT